jgi:S-adenosylmethionine hydrolase
MQLVSLTTDYGSKDYYAAELKASILSKNPHITLLDLSHHIDHFDILQAAFFVKNAIGSFAQGSIHIISVHTHYRRKPEIICFEYDGQFFVGPNNGVFSIMFPELTEQGVFLVNHTELQALSMHQVYAHVCGYLSHGLPLNEIGPQIITLTQKSVIQPVVLPNLIRATIIHIDEFENVIINLRYDLFDRVRNGRRFELYYKQYDPINYLSKDYGDVAIGDPLAFFNCAGYLEIAMNMDKASSLLNLYKNEMIQINFY